VSYTQELRRKRITEDEVKEEEVEKD